MNLFGFDPGGIKKFGWAVLRVDQTGDQISLATGVTSDVQTSINNAFEAGGKIDPTVVGIDSPLFWVEQGDRSVDAYIRKRVCSAGGHPGTVGHVNSLWGACLVQGVLTARRVSMLWPSTKITETHPKALLLVWPELNEFLSAHCPTTITEHERDSIIGAYSAWAMATNNPKWLDLVTMETDPFFPSGKPVSYWFPKG